MDNPGLVWSSEPGRLTLNNGETFFAKDYSECKCSKEKHNELEKKNPVSGSVNNHQCVLLPTWSRYPLTDVPNGMPVNFEGDKAIVTDGKVKWIYDLSSRALTSSWRHLRNDLRAVRDNPHFAGGRLSYLPCGELLISTKWAKKDLNFTRLYGREDTIMVTGEFGDVSAWGNKIAFQSSSRLLVFDTGGTKLWGEPLSLEQDFIGIAVGSSYVLVVQCFPGGRAGCRFSLHSLQSGKQMAHYQLEAGPDETGMNFRPQPPVTSTDGDLFLIPGAHYFHLLVPQDSGVEVRTHYMKYECRCLLSVGRDLTLRGETFPQEDPFWDEVKRYSIAFEG